ncbi:polysaccharide pyruvyl transferase family protein [Pseudolysinimonas sp.]|uniref:polysaccharide pyruvyl transferase family protein n=1 Tax=Pseudolysinimonas sp. TaxID=2680009 RepID=UPI00286A8B87|nr:polysaccharide pyruvyl transferase family protein [Pseudolysinimonas sp.]
MTRRDGQLELVDVAGVDVAAWNPVRGTGRWGQPVPVGRPLSNFGDLLGPVIVRELVAQLRLAPATRRHRLFAVGSVLHFALAGDVIWGAGRNAKAEPPLEGLDVRAVRGPRTAAGYPGAVVGGDPALLLGGLRPDLLVDPARRSGVTVVPNLNELSQVRDRRTVVSPRAPLNRVLRTLARSTLVVGSSLHAVIVAEALGVPARAVRAVAEPGFKYEDYYLATGRDPDEVVAADVEEALERGGAPAPVWDPGPLLEAFPTELWTGGPVLDGLNRIAERTREAAGRSRQDPRTGVTTG